MTQHQPRQWQEQILTSFYELEHTASSKHIQACTNVYNPMFVLEWNVPKIANNRKAGGIIKESYNSLLRTDLQRS